jgi:hypothetical protein
MLRRGLFYPLPAGAYLIKARKRVYAVPPLRLRFCRERRRCSMGATARAVARQSHVSVVEIYTDGACRGNPGPGGWARARSSRAKHLRELSGAEAHTTNNRMELTAAIEALEALKRPVEARALHRFEIRVHRHRPNGCRTGSAATGAPPTRSP